MATLSDLLENFGLNGDVGEEKTASEQASAGDDEEQALLENLLADDNEKTASEGGTQMGSLADLYLQMQEQDSAGADDDFDKIAEAAAQEEVTETQSIEKMAQEYDAAGRIMARGFFDEFHKLARELEEGSDAATPALGERGTGWQMETNVEDKGSIVTKGSQSVNSDALKGGADLGAEKAMGSQFTTAKSLVTSRAGQANAK